MYFVTGENKRNLSYLFNNSSDFRIWRIVVYQNFQRKIWQILETLEYSLVSSGRKGLQKSYTETLNGALQWLIQGRCLGPLIFRPNWGPKGQKKIGETAPPPPPFISVSGWLGPSPYLPLIWLVENLFRPMKSSNYQFFPQATACTRTLRSNSTLACFTENRKWHTRNPSAVIRLGPSRINIRRSLDAHSILQGNQHHTKKVQMHSRDSYKDIM